MITNPTETVYEKPAFLFKIFLKFVFKSFLFPWQHNKNTFVLQRRIPISQVGVI